MYLGDGHGDVEELAPASLRDGSGEEQLQPVFGEQRLLILETEKHSVQVSFICSLTLESGLIKQQHIIYNSIKSVDERRDKVSRPAQ